MQSKLRKANKMNIEQLKAARDALNYADSNNLRIDDIGERSKQTIRTLLDQAINAPDLRAEKKDTSNTQELLANCEDFTVGYNTGWNAAIDHLAPRIVREGCVVVPEEPTPQMIANGALTYTRYDKSSGRMARAYKAMLAASKGD